MTFRVLLGGARCAERHPDAVVVCPVERRVRNLLPPIVHLSPSRHRMLSLLMIRFGRLVEYEELADWMWSEEPDGGPLTMTNTIGVHVNELRRSLHSTPVGITTRWGLGLLAEPANLARRATLHARYHLRRQEQETAT